MAEKVIHEVRFIETEDGFRIEVKGDKERLKEIGCGPGLGFAPGMLHMGGMHFGPGAHFMRRMRKARRQSRRGFGPWAWWNWFDEEEESPGDDEPSTKA